mmetsp:Transcript_76781/g.144681  ORF Transcript_76781/g.144681 Transcript_76781/m.144681 type:complete len:438 (+) Transcript_76781:73-1386(+)
MTGAQPYRSRKMSRWQGDLKEQRNRNAEAAAAGCAVYVRGVPASWSAMQVNNFFSDRWLVESVNLLPKKPQSRARAAFVNFGSSKDAQAAVDSCDKQNVEEVPGGDVYWLACSLKKDAHKKVEVAACDFMMPSEVLENFLYLGNRSNAGDERGLENMGISHMLSVVADSDEEIATPAGMERIVLHAADSSDEDIAALFPRAVQFLQQVHEAGGRVLVHCVAGRSRSASLVIAYLMRRCNMTLNEAFTLLKEKRPVVLPNSGFWQQLEAEELKIFGVASPTPLHYKRHGADEVCPAERTCCTRKPARYQGQMKCLQGLHQTEGCSFNAGDRELLMVHLQAGSLSNAPERLRQDLQTDLGHFSKLHGVSAHASCSEDVISIKGCSTEEQAGTCRAELQQILHFYGFAGIGWSPPLPQSSARGNASIDSCKNEEARVSRW